jgi:hypothetical protein
LGLVNIFLFRQNPNDDFGGVGVFRITVGADHGDAVSAMGDAKNSVGLTPNVRGRAPTRARPFPVGARIGILPDFQAIPVP